MGHTSQLLTITRHIKVTGLSVLVIDEFTRCTRDTPIWITCPESPLLPVRTGSERSGGEETGGREGSGLQAFNKNLGKWGDGSVTQRIKHP